MNALATMTIGAWLPQDPISAGLVILASAITIGLLIGAIRVRGIALGISGVLFSALLFGQLGLTVDAGVLHFLSDFSLVIFMYAIGLDVGPAFLSSLRAEGLRLNLLSLITIALAALLTSAFAFFLGNATASGLFSGTFTTTPGLAAAQEILRHQSNPVSPAITREASAGLAYSITYPFGVVGPLFLIYAVRRLFGINLQKEKEAFLATEESRHPPRAIVDFEVTRSTHAGTRLGDHPLLASQDVTISRLLRKKVLSVPTADTLFQLGDIFRAVGPRHRLSQLVIAMGRERTMDLGGATGDLQRIDVVVTRTDILHRPIRELNPLGRLGAVIVGVNRAGVDLAPNNSLRLAFADRISIVGPQPVLKTLKEEFGNSTERLNRAQLIPIFLGIFLGVLAGTIPFAIPGTSLVLRLGLAGGPLVIAIALAQLGNIGSIVWYMPAAANQVLRDFGLAVFLACVGLQSGNHFLENAAGPGGFMLFLYGIVVTLLPVFAVACFARFILRMNFITLSGWIAGVTTSSPALMLSRELTQSDGPALAYAAVAPIAELIPIFCAQIIAAS